MTSFRHTLVVSAALLGAAFGAQAAGFTLSSPTIKSGSMLSDAQVFNGFGCTGKNVSPALAWSGAPAGTKSYAVTVYDPDAPTGSGWWHWVVFNIPASAANLAEGAGTADGKALPAGSTQGRTDFGAPGFGGACPPAGDKPHRYQITVFAVDVDKLPIAKNAKASAASVGFDLHFHTLAKTTLTGLFGR